MSAPKIVIYEYRGVKVVIGKTPTYNLWRASLDGKTIVNTFFKSEYEADAHCKSIIDARATYQVPKHQQCRLEDM
jgi:hypothetical protein